MAPLAILTKRFTFADGPADVKPDYTTFPFMKQLQQIAGSVQGTVLIVLVILMVVGVGLLVAGKLGSSNMAQRVGWGIIVTCIVAAVIAANAGQLVDWGATKVQINGTDGGNVSGSGGATAAAMYVVGSLLP